MEDMMLKARNQNQMRKQNWNSGLVLADHTPSSLGSSTSEFQSQNPNTPPPDLKSQALNNTLEDESLGAIPHRQKKTSG